jgi:hypothetical protein
MFALTHKLSPNKPMILRSTFQPHLEALKPCEVLSAAPRTIARLLHPCHLTLFFALSAADLVLTWWLVVHTGNEVYESNPVAAWWLARYGWAGLTVFKGVAVLLVTGLATVISLGRPQIGGRVLTFGCAAVGAVVCYSAFLVWSLHEGVGVDGPVVIRLALDRLPPSAPFHPPR